MKPLYTAEATVFGGRNGQGRTSDGLLDVELRVPEKLGGSGDGTNPEQLFAVGFAACFDSAIGTASRRLHVDPGDVRIESRVTLVATADRAFDVSVEMDVTLAGVADPEQAVAIVATAHQICPYSRATRGNIDVALTANGRPVE